MYFFPYKKSRYSILWVLEGSCWDYWFLTIFDYLIFCLFIAFLNIARRGWPLQPHKEREKVPTKFWLRVLVKSTWKQKS